MSKFNPAPWRRGAETWEQYVIRAGLYAELSVCGCCLFIIANGETCADDDCTTCAEGGGYDRYFQGNRGHVSLGRFTDECGHDTQDQDQHETHINDCERFGFRWSSCDLCRSGDGGDRYAAVFWPERPDNDMIDSRGVSWE